MLSGTIEQRPILFIERPAHFWRACLPPWLRRFASCLCGGASVIIGLGIGQVLHQEAVGIILLILLLIGTIVLTFVVGIALSPKRHIDFYADESRTNLLLKVLQDKKFRLITATYTVLTPGGTLLGRMRKNYLYNIFRKKWDGPRSGRQPGSDRSRRLADPLALCDVFSAHVRPAPHQFHPLDSGS